MQYKLGLSCAKLRLSCAELLSKDFILGFANLVHLAVRLYSRF
jgi:hypothetical protein